MNDYKHRNTNKSKAVKKLMKAHNLLIDVQEEVLNIHPDSLNNKYACIKSIEAALGQIKETFMLID